MKNFVKVVYDNLTERKRAKIFLNEQEMLGILSLNYSAELDKNRRIITKVTLEFYADCIIESED